MNAGALVRLPLLAFLKTIEPAVRIVLGLLAFCGVLVALFLRFLAEVPHFPFWGMLGSAIACALLLMGFSRLVQWLSH